MNIKQNADVGQLLLRVALGLLFIIPGFSKLMDPSGITGMLAGVGFPAAALFAWIVLLSEIIFGIALVIGWRTQKTAWPLVIILIVATLFFGLPGIDMANPMSIMNVLWHLVGIAGLLSVIYTGPGKHRIKG